MNRLPLLLCLGLLVMPTAGLAQAPYGAGLSPEDDRAIRQLAADFGAAIVAKDRAAFAPLVLSDAITFATALDDTTYQRLLLRRPEAPRHEIDSWPGFVDFIVSAPEHREETFGPLSIQGDGTIASVYFDYAFLEDGVVTNDGHETWSVLKTAGGWKIASVVWSTAIPAP